MVHAASVRMPVRAAAFKNGVCCSSCRRMESKFLSTMACISGLSLDDMVVSCAVVSGDEMMRG